MPPYYKPTDSVGSGSTYYPTSEELGKDEMRITFVGSCPFPPRRNQAATCIMVELGNGKRFFFDFGPGCLRNILAMQVLLGWFQPGLEPTGRPRPGCSAGSRRARRS